MTRQIALIAYSLVIIGLFLLDRDRKARTSPALWLAVIWLFLGASRAVSLWFGSAPIMASPSDYLEGSPVDRGVYAVLLGAAIFVLVRRSSRTWAFLRANSLILLFLLYCAASVLWSDFPFVAFKRWTKTLGNVAMVLIVLTDAEPLAAFKRVFARTGFLLIPISVLFIKYYPELSRGYLPGPAGWRTFYSGVANEKNGLGIIWLIWGLVSVWRFAEAYSVKNTPGRTRILVAHVAVLGMVYWLLKIADSSTSSACLALGSVLLLVSPRLARRRPAAIHALVATLACMALTAYIFEDVWTSLVHSLGRQTDLTGRTDLWKELFHFNVNPLVGTGFESFWLGQRASHFWAEYWWHPNQAHNGYLETYLNLGWIGVALLALLMAMAYRNVVQAFRRNLPWAPVLLSFVVTVAVYNMTEAAFKVTHPVYIAFLFAAIAPPAIRTYTEKHALAAPGRLGADPTTQIEVHAFEVYGHRKTARRSPEVAPASRHCLETRQERRAVGELFSASPKSGEGGAVCFSEGYSRSKRSGT